MPLFKQMTCPLEDSYLPVYGIQAPQKWKPEDCPECQYQEKDKCQYKKVLERQEQFHKWGQPVLAKRANLSNSAIQRKKAETEALKKAGMASQEQNEYWLISGQFDLKWESADIEGRKEIMEQLDQWKVHLEKGLAPSEAFYQVQEWLKQREEFRKRV